MGASHFGMEYLDLSDDDDEDEKEALPDTDSEASDIFLSLVLTASKTVIPVIPPHHPK